ncbi:H/ACA ribonucleoprotein complex subunit GAR1 [Methanohalophilus profundi]|uniref:H/ACA ribonucleoprotein complex subunit GAR1 n=1 Tax=Methanohalophilus profundi TaxID=2138083 RepID=UPI0013EE12DB|nr:Gar1/Naf1 family protein [Methanohalophilus profundi]
MKRLGVVYHLIGGRKLIVKGSENMSYCNIKELPRKGSAVLDKKVARIGKVSDIIGPASRPYVVVKIFSDVPDSKIKSWIREKVYVK